MMDWVNCNLCCRQPGDEKERMFMLSSCGHFFCDLCLAQAESRNKCRVCSSQCQLIQLSSKMKPEAEVFFQEPIDLLKKQQSQMSRLLEFQKEHRIRLVYFYRKMLMKAKELERRYKLASEKIQQLEKDNMKLKEIVNSGIKGGGEYGVMSGNIHPHDSYQRAINASSLRNSPQGSPNSFATRLTPGRLTLLKGKAATSANRISPNLPSDEMRMRGRQPSSFLQAREGFAFPSQVSPSNNINNGTPLFSAAEGPRVISPFSSRTNIGGNYYIREDSPSSQQNHHHHSQSLPYSQGKKLEPFQIHENPYAYKSRSPNQMFLSQDVPGGHRNNSDINIRSYPRCHI